MLLVSSALGFLGSLVSYARPCRQHSTPLSGGRTESLCRGASGPDGRLRAGRHRDKGPGMDLVRRPSEQRWSERTLRKAQGRMKGGVSLLTFFAQAKKVSRPEGAKPEVSEHSEIGSEPDSLDATRGSLSGPRHYPDFIRATRGKKRARPGPGSRTSQERRGLRRWLPAGLVPVRPPLHR